MTDPATEEVLDMAAQLFAKGKELRTEAERLEASAKLVGCVQPATAVSLRRRAFRLRAEARYFDHGGDELASLDPTRANGVVLQKMAAMLGIKEVTV